MVQVYDIFELRKSLDMTAKKLGINVKDYSDLESFISEVLWELRKLIIKYECEENQHLFTLYFLEYYKAQQYYKMIYKKDI